MEISEFNVSIEDNNSSKPKSKKRSLIERELETSLTPKVTSPVVNNSESSTSRYGRTRRPKTDKEFVDSDVLNSCTKISKLIDSPRDGIPHSKPITSTPNQNNSSFKSTPDDDTKKEDELEELSETSNKSSSIKGKNYIRKDLIQNKSTAKKSESLQKNIPSWKKNTHLNNILERSLEKYNLGNRDQSQSLSSNKATVVKALNFDCSLKKESKDKKPISKVETYDDESTCDYELGDLAWARVGTFPFWPCIVTREPSSEVYVKNKLFGKVSRDVIHVTFFGDNGSRGWIVENMLRKYKGISEFEEARNNFTIEDKKKDPKMFAAFFVSSKKQALWKNSVEEAELLLKKSKQIRVDSFYAMLEKTRATKTKSKQKEKSKKVIRTDSDVSLSESLYDSLFSKDGKKLDENSKSKNKSFDVSDVVTACLDNMAAKTGITQIQKQSHMDRWLQKAKSKTPEKLTVVAAKKKCKDIKLLESSSVDISQSEKSKKMHVQRKKSDRQSFNQNETDTSEISDISGLGFISKVETLSGKNIDINNSVDEFCIIENVVSDYDNSSQNMDVNSTINTSNTQCSNNINSTDTHSLQDKTPLVEMNINESPVKTKETAPGGTYEIIFEHYDINTNDNRTKEIVDKSELSQAHSIEEHHQQDTMDTSSIVNNKNNPEFFIYLESQKDALLDDSPNLTQDEVVAYLYKTWLYEKSKSSDEKQSLKDSQVIQKNISKQHTSIKKRKLSKNCKKDIKVTNIVEDLAIPVDQQNETSLKGNTIKIMSVSDINESISNSIDNQDSLETSLIAEETIQKKNKYKFPATDGLQRRQRNSLKSKHKLQLKNNTTNKKLNNIDPSYNPKMNLSDLEIELKNVSASLSSMMGSNNTDELNYSSILTSDSDISQNITQNKNDSLTPLKNVKSKRKSNSKTNAKTNNTEINKSSTSDKICESVNDGSDTDADKIISKTSKVGNKGVRKLRSTNDTKVQNTSEYTSLEHIESPQNDQSEKKLINDEHNSSLLCNLKNTSKTKNNDTNDNVISEITTKNIINEENQLVLNSKKVMPVLSIKKGKINKIGPKKEKEIKTDDFNNKSIENEASAVTTKKSLSLQDFSLKNNSYDLSTILLEVEKAKQNNDFVNYLDLNVDIMKDENPELTQNEIICYLYKAWSYDTNKSNNQPLLQNVNNNTRSKKLRKSKKSKNQLGLQSWRVFVERMKITNKCIKIENLKKSISEPCSIDIVNGYHKNEEKLEINESKDNYDKTSLRTRNKQYLRSIKKNINAKEIADDIGNLHIPCEMNNKTLDTVINTKDQDKIVNILMNNCVDQTKINGFIVSDKKADDEESTSESKIINETSIEVMKTNLKEDNNLNLNTLPSEIKVNSITEAVITSLDVLQSNKVNKPLKNNQTVHSISNISQDVNMDSSVVSGNCVKVIESNTLFNNDSLDNNTMDTLNPICVLSSVNEIDNEITKKLNSIESLENSKIIDLKNIASAQLLEDDTINMFCSKLYPEDKAVSNLIILTSNEESLTNKVCSPFETMKEVSCDVAKASNDNNSCELSAQTKNKTSEDINMDISIPINSSTTDANSSESMTLQDQMVVKPLSPTVISDEIEGKKLIDDCDIVDSNTVPKDDTVGKEMQSNPLYISSDSSKASNDNNSCELSAQTKNKTSEDINMDISIPINSSTTDANSSESMTLQDQMVVKPLSPTVISDEIEGKKLIDDCDIVDSNTVPKVDTVGKEMQSNPLYISSDSSKASNDNNSCELSAQTKNKTSEDINMDISIPINSSTTDANSSESMTLQDQMVVKPLSPTVISDEIEGKKLIDDYDIVDSNTVPKDDTVGKEMPSNPLYISSDSSKKSLHVPDKVISVKDNNNCDDQLLQTNAILATDVTCGAWGSIPKATQICNNEVAPEETLEHHDVVINKNEEINTPPALIEDFTSNQDMQSKTDTESIHTNTLIEEELDDFSMDEVDSSHLDIAKYEKSINDINSCSDNETSENFPIPDKSCNSKTSTNEKDLLKNNNDSAISSTIPGEYDSDMDKSSIKECDKKEENMNQLEEINTFLKNSDFAKYVEIKQDKIMDENSDLTYEEVVRYLHKTWLYEEGNNLTIDDQTHLVKDCVVESKSKSNKIIKKSLSLNKSKIKQYFSKPKESESNSSVVESDDGKKLRKKASNDVDASIETIKETLNVGTHFPKPKESESNSSVLESDEDKTLYKKASNDIEASIETNKELNVPASHINLHSKELHGKELHIDATKPKHDASQEQNSSSKNKIMDNNEMLKDPEFCHYYEIKKDSVLDDNPALNSDEVISYLHKIWLYDTNKNLDTDLTKLVKEPIRSDESDTEETVIKSTNIFQATSADADTVSVTSEESLVLSKLKSNLSESKDNLPKDVKINQQCSILLLKENLSSRKSKENSPIRKLKAHEFDSNSVNSEDSDVSISRLKRFKQSKLQINKKCMTMKDMLEIPDFVKYLDLKQDDLIDEHPELNQQEIVSYLYNIWLYEESLKSDGKMADDEDQTSLIKGLDQKDLRDKESQIKRIKKNNKSEKVSFVEYNDDKEKSKRNISRACYNEEYSDTDDDNDDGIDYYEIFNIKSKSTPKTEATVTSLKQEGELYEDIKPLQENVIKTQEIEDIVDENVVTYTAEMYFDQLTKPKPNVFKGLTREKVCEVCETVGNLVKCKTCHAMFHVDCTKKKLQVVETVNPPAKRGRKKKYKCKGRRSNEDGSGDALNMSFEEIVDSESNYITDAETFEAQLELKMKEILEKAEKQKGAFYYTGGDLNWNKTVPGQCEIVDIVPKVIPPADTTDYSNFKCNNCKKHETPLCFVCKSSVSPKSQVQRRQRCQVAHCNRYYHIDCLDHWPQTQFGSSKKEEESFICPRHVCHTCICDDPRGCKTRFSGDKLARCVRCPATYHTFMKCLPAGSQVLTGSQIICPRHVEHKSGKVPCHVNTGWCFICALGGSLICCEYCPMSFHAECLNISPPEGNYMCEECETGRLPLYGEMVWVKLGHYRWWPGLILHPTEVPLNVMAVKHTQGEFVVRFFGQYDYFWVNRGRVFPFQEGDSGRLSKQNTKIDNAFSLAVSHAKRACEILKNAKENDEESQDIAQSLLPPHYVKLKVNKPYGSVTRKADDEESSLTQCECNPNCVDPCGPTSQCINRMLLTECGPICRAGDSCNNRQFEKRQYPKLTAYRTPQRGWGLKALEDIEQGQFVIEYVGELIDEKEFRRRMQRKQEIRDENYYFLTLDKERMIDAGPKGNLARFMNHCCEPNCETQKWTVLGDVRVGLFAIDDIPAGSEVTFNYNLECAGSDKKRCMCGAKRCSGYIGAKPKQDLSLPKKPKRQYRKRKPPEEPTLLVKNKTPKPRQTSRSKPKELTEIEKDLLIIKNAITGISSDSESSSRLSSLGSELNLKALKRKRLSMSSEDVSNCDSSSPAVKRIKTSDALSSDVGD